MSKTVCQKNLCCGCNACINICPKQCIKLVDNIKELNAEIDKNKCINCKLCESVCQVVNEQSNLIKFNKTLNCFEGVTKDKVINESASSGGFATTLGVEFAKNGGYVVGIKSDKERFYFDITNNSEEIIQFAGSKYVKVDTKDIYKKIKARLIAGDKVLFFGVPCQIAGLYMFLQKKYENLFTVDLICHGTPSEKVLLKYLNEKKIFTGEQQLSFRKKHFLQLSIKEKPLIDNKVCDAYIVGFVNGLFYTENCYQCKYAREERISDITIGDSWGSTNAHGLNNLSLILQNTKKADYLISLLTNKFLMYDCDYENAKHYNHQLMHPSKKQPYTDYYFNNFNSKTTKKIVKKAYPKIMFKQFIKKILVKLHLY